MNRTTSDYRSIVQQDPCAFIERAFHELNPGTEYQPGWHLEVIASELEACRLGETKRLIINLPPRSGKSHAVSVAFPAYLLGHQPTAQIICASYGQELAQKLAFDCRSLMMSEFYQRLFPTRLSAQRQATQDFATTAGGFRFTTSVGGPLTGRGGDYIIVDDALKADEALSDTKRKAANNWFDQTLFSRLNDKRKGCIIVVMQRLHEDDLVGHLLAQGGWKLVRFPAIAEDDENYEIETPYGVRTFQRRAGEALHPEREPLELLQQMREWMGEYAFASQYQQSPAPLDGGLVKVAWFKFYGQQEVPHKFDMVFQSWDTANKPTELNDYSVCTTWGAKNKQLYLLHVCRKRLAYPDLKRAVREQAEAFQPQTILIEDRASGTQLIQDLTRDGLHQIKQYSSSMDKVMRMNSVTSTMENGFVHLPEKAEWLAEYLHELSTFPNGKFDDQADSTSQALDWFKQLGGWPYGIFAVWKEEAEKIKADEALGPNFRNLHRWKRW